MLNFNLSTSLYIAFDKNGAALYVGISSQPKCRLKDHQRLAAWYLEMARVEIHEHKNRFSAMQAEREAIEKYLPPFNLSLNPRFRRVGYNYQEIAT